MNEITIDEIINNTVDNCSGNDEYKDAVRRVFHYGLKLDFLVLFEEGKIPSKDEFELMLKNIYQDCKIHGLDDYMKKIKPYLDNPTDIFNSKKYLQENYSQVNQF